MPVRSFTTNLCFHFCGARSVLSSYICSFLCLRLYLFFFFRPIIGLSFEDNSARHRFFNLIVHLIRILKNPVQRYGFSIRRPHFYLSLPLRNLKHTMNSNFLTPDKDPMGAAISDFCRHGKAGRLRVFSSQFDEDEIPVKQLFRTFGQMPVLEQTALKLARGKILDVGAGSGCHALALQDMGKEVCAIDISPLAVEAMKEQGVKDVRLLNLFDEHFHETFDTILMLMNGSGIIGRIENMPAFFLRMKQLLSPGGCVLMDSSDLRYLFEEEDGSFLIDIAGDYYGQVDFRLQYKDIKGEPFDWLYIDPQTLELYASQNGFKVEIVKHGKHYDYLAKILMNSE